MTWRQIVLVMALIVLLFEGDLFAQRLRMSGAVVRVFAVCTVPIFIIFAIFIVQKWFETQ